MHGDDAPLDVLRLDLDALRGEVERLSIASQETKSQVMELSARQAAVEGRMIAVSEMIEESRLH